MPRSNINDLWQRAGLSVVTVSNDEKHADRELAAVVNEIERLEPGLISRTEVEFLGIERCGSRNPEPDRRVADQIRAEVSMIIARELHDPGVGFVTITRVQVSPDLQHARVFYTSLGDAAARKNTARALERAASFMRRQIGQRLRLRRAPEVQFEFDQSIGHQDRVEQLLRRSPTSTLTHPTHLTHLTHLTPDPDPDER